MKGLAKFLLGVVVGFVLCLGCVFILAAINSDSEVDGLTLFEEPGDCISTKPFKIIQVTSDGNALAMEKSSDLDIYTGMVVLFLSDKNTSFYDDQIIAVPSGSCVKQMGTYRYVAGSGSIKTVPAVAIK